MARSSCVSFDYYNVKNDGKEKLFREFIFGGKDKYDVLESYYNNLLRPIMYVNNLHA